MIKAILFDLDETLLDIDLDKFIKDTFSVYVTIWKDLLIPKLLSKIFGLQPEPW